MHLIRSNPKTDRFGVQRFHHIEFWCGDASNTWRRFAWGLGMHLVAKSDPTTGNQTYCSYAIQSNDLAFTFTAPLSSKIAQSHSNVPHPGYNSEEARGFIASHGLAVKALGVLVDDAADAHRVSVANGAVSVLEPHVLTDDNAEGTMAIAEVRLYGDVVLRFVSTQDFTGPMLPNYEHVKSMPLTYGLVRLDHVAANVHKLTDSVPYIVKFSGLHEFAEFTADDVGTAESGLNNVVLASNNDMVLLAINEPTFGTKRKSQIQTYLEHNEGPGLQHLALACDDIFTTLREMRTRTHLGGFDFMPKPPPSYYQNLANRVGSVLTEEQIEMCAELGIMVDKDDQGVLLQIFTQPLGDRPTVFIEIIQRVGCMEKDGSGRKVQKGGCGGFGKGNISELFKCVEEYEKSLFRNGKA